MVASIANLVNELPPELPNDLRLRILGNKEMSVKPQSFVDTQPSSQCPFQKLKVDNSSPTTTQQYMSVYQNFLTFSVLLDFCISFQIFCPGLSHKRSFGLNSVRSPRNFNFLMFCKSSKHLSKFYGKQKGGQALQTSEFNSYA